MKHSQCLHLMCSPRSLVWKSSSPYARRFSSMVSTLMPSKHLPGFRWCRCSHCGQDCRGERLRPAGRRHNLSARRNLLKTKQSAPLARAQPRAHRRHSTSASCTHHGGLELVCVLLLCQVCVQVKDSLFSARCSSPTSDYLADRFKISFTLTGRADYDFESQCIFESIFESQ
jgi:hypothetical protein